MSDSLTFTLDEESEKRLLDLLTDIDVSVTPSFTIKDKHGNTAKYVKIITCKDCKFYKAVDMGYYNFLHGCDLTDRMKFADDYCSNAEKRGE